METKIQIKSKINEDAKKKWAVYSSGLNFFNKDNQITIFKSIKDDWSGNEGEDLCSPSWLKKKLEDANGSDIEIIINSPGGSFFGGLAMYNLLKDYKGKVTCKVVGLAASAASLIVLGADEIEIVESGFFLFHCAWTLAIGNSEGFKKLSEDLDQLDNAAKEIFKAKTGKSLEEINALFSEDRYMSAKEAKELRIADRIVKGPKKREENTDNKNVSATVQRIKEITQTLNK